MPISLIKKNQLDPDINDLVGQYGSGYFLSTGVSGQLTNLVITALSGFSGVLTIGGLQGILALSGTSGIHVGLDDDNNSILISYTGEAPQNIAYTTGNQILSGDKNFVGNLLFSGEQVLSVNTFTAESRQLNSNAIAYAIALG